MAVYQGDDDEAIFPSSPSHQGGYHVFLSFRGEDTRKTFTDHLYTALSNAGFRTFRDDEGIELGEDVSSELQNAIRQSRSSIIIFSKDYASSRWCLDELSLIILQHKKKTTSQSRHVVLPVFYDVDPSDVRKQTGSFAKAFRRHEKKYSKDVVRRWRDALKEAADLSGMVLKNEKDGHESKFIQKIVTTIDCKLHKNVAVLPPYLIEMESRTWKINQWVCDQSSNISIAAICGAGGIGKTTIAKCVYNANHGRFDAHSFLEDIRETSKRGDGLVQLQERLLSDVLKGTDVKIRSFDEGIIKIQGCLHNKRILLVLDDVDHIDQINAIFGMRNWFKPGSKIIITTRHEHLLRSVESYMGYNSTTSNLISEDHGFYKVFRVKELGHDSSCKLFNWYAFGHEYHLEDYAVESVRMVNYCGGLPLALKVLGSSLCGKSSIDVWRSTTDKLQAIPNSQVMEKLKISYDSLQDDHDRDLFLHIVFFFIGIQKDVAVKILDACEFYTVVGIDNLIEHCVLTVDKHNKLRMHQLVRDMGREIVRLESPKNPGKCSRLWLHKDSFSVLRDKSGTDTVEGLILEMSMRNKHIEENEIELEVDAFTGMRKMAILQLKHVRLIGNYENFPRRLKWLSWEGFPHETIPNSVHLETTVALDMRCSSLNQLMTQNKHLGALKFLDLSHSHFLANTPDFSYMPNLERLKLQYCISLVEIHESLGCLQKLLVLNLKECKNLENLPESIVMLKSLETFDVSGCRSVKSVPELRKLESLKEFLVDGLDLGQLLSASSDISSGILIAPRTSPKISWAQFLSNTLVSLNLSNCGLYDDDFPRELSHLSSLQKLHLGGNLFRTLPDFVRHLKLQSLNFRSCKNLEFIEGLTKPMGLGIEYCTSLKRITYNSDQWTKTSREVFFTHFGCSSLVEIQERFKLEPLEKMNAELIKAEGLHRLEVPQKLQVMIASTYWDGLSPCPIQGIFDDGVFSVFIPGQELPKWLNHRCEGSSLSLSVPNHRVQGLNLCVVYSYNYDQHDWLPNESRLHLEIIGLYIYQPLRLEVLNRTKRLRWLAAPMFYAVPKVEDEHISWFCHLKWKEPDHFEEGDQLHVKVSTIKDHFHLRECGANFVYDAYQDSFDGSSDVRETSHSNGNDSRNWFQPGIIFSNMHTRPSIEIAREDEDAKLNIGNNDCDMGNLESNKAFLFLLVILILTGLLLASFYSIYKSTSRA